MADVTELRLDGDLPAVPSVDFQPAWDKEVTGSNAAILQEFKEWFLEEGLPETEDAHLVKFVHSCDYDIEKAKKCAKDFYWSRGAVPELFTGWDTSLPNLQSILDVIQVAIVPRTTPNNFRVLINSLRTSDTTNYVIADVYKITLMLVESIFLTEPTIGGIIIIQDVDKITFTHLLKMLWSMPRKIQVYFEDGIPIKRDKVHIINSPSLVEKGMKMMSRIMRKEDMEKMMIYKGDDYTELQSHIPLDCLPSDYGGTQPSVKELHAMTVQRLTDFKEVFLQHLTPRPR